MKAVQIIRYKTLHNIDSPGRSKFVILSKLTHAYCKCDNNNRWILNPAEHDAVPDLSERSRARE
jgi:hypothetical protein